MQLEWLVCTRYCARHGRQVDADRHSPCGLLPTSLSLSLQVYIFLIANVNHHRPQFLEPHYEVRVPQDTLPGVELLRVQATDEDKGKGLIYTIQGSQDLGSASLFQLDPSTGVLVTVGKLDLGSGPSQHTLTVMVSDLGAWGWVGLPSVPIVLDTGQSGDTSQLARGFFQKGCLKCWQIGWLPWKSLLALVFSTLPQNMSQQSFPRSLWIHIVLELEGMETRSAKALGSSKEDLLSESCACVCT